MAKSKLEKQYDKCLKIANELSAQMQELSRLASKEYGQELQADICNGDEIEFRIVDENGLPDAFWTIRIEEVLN